MKRNIIILVCCLFCSASVLAQTDNAALNDQPVAATTVTTSTASASQPNNAAENNVSTSSDAPSSENDATPQTTDQPPTAEIQSVQNAASDTSQIEQLQITIQMQQAKIKQMEADNVNLQSDVDQQQLKAEQVYSQLSDLDATNKLLKANNNAQANQIIALHNFIRSMQADKSEDAQKYPTLTNSLLERTHHIVDCINQDCSLKPSDAMRNATRLGDQAKDRVKRFISSPSFTPAIFVAVILVILLVVILAFYRYGFSRSGRSSYRRAKKIDNDMQSVSGEDVSASKIDLAHAYIDMKDYKNAKTVLRLVEKSSNAEHRKVAKELLDKIQQLKNKK